MALLNKTALLGQLKTKAETSTNSAVFSALIAALDNLTDDRAVTLETENNLPPAYTVGTGTIFYINSLNTLVVAIGAKWFGLDGRLLRDDVSAQFALGWGDNTTGRIGDGTAVPKSRPVLVIGGVTDWSQISAGTGHTLAVTSGGVAYAWGINSYGRLGNNTAVSSLSPITVVGGITNWSQIKASGGGHSIGLADGIAYAWGRNQYGNLADGTTISRSSPVTVVGGITNWSKISAGTNHTIGIVNGVAYSWGRNGNGNIGDNTVVNRSSPVTVVGGITEWSDVSAGGVHSLGIANGIVYAWGNNVFGRLGDGSTSQRNSPVTVVGNITNWLQISAGDSHSVGITDKGVAYAWGSNGTGRLGDGTAISRSSPVTVIGGITNWSQVSAGGEHTIASTSTGIVYAWGSNGNGRLGDGTTIARSSPVTLASNINRWVQVSAGNAHTSGIALD